MSQTAHKSRTTQFIYRFDMNSTFDLADLYAPLQKALALTAVGFDEAPNLAGPPWSLRPALADQSLDVPDSCCPWPPILGLAICLSYIARILPSANASIKFIIGTQQYKPQQ